MKKTGIKILYRLFSFLSDRTNGFKPFVKYKFIFGALLIGVTTTSCNILPPEISCYDTMPEVTCYVAPPPVDTTTVAIQSTQPTYNLDKNESDETTK